MIRNTESFRLNNYLCYQKKTRIRLSIAKEGKSYFKEPTGGEKSFVNSLNSLKSSPISICGLFKAIFNTAKVAQALSTT